VKGERKTWKERAWELLDGQREERLRPGERIRERLQWEDWEGLRREATVVAAEEIKRRRWRGARDGVLPGCLGAEDVAGQVIAEVLEGKGRLTAGLAGPKLTAELGRLVRQKIRLLHRLKEAPRVRSEWEVAPTAERGERASVFSAMHGGAGTGYEAAVEREEEERREGLRAEFEDFLKGEPELVEVFRCLWAGVMKPAEIARRLGMEEKGVAALRKRLERRVAQFGRGRG
jgi:hypothetical protein